MSFDFNSLFSQLAETDKPAEKVGISSDLFASMLGGLSPVAENTTITEIKEYSPRGERKPHNHARDMRRSTMRLQKNKNIAVIDFETDPFDNVNKTKIYPFLAVLYSDDFEPIVIWNNDFEAFKSELFQRLEELPQAYTIYAHNGGKFDYMFLLSQIKGQIQFKGRGIMVAQLGKHELRDSFHIIPDRLANFKKDHIDYENMKRDKRGKYKKEIIKYCINDCRYLLDIVKYFVQSEGLVLSIGQAAMARIRQNYKFDRLTEEQDTFFRDYFHGGRVECLQGKTRRKGKYKLYDVNSMYPFVMATYEHPIGNFYIPHTGSINENTMFIDITCVSNGAFVLRDEKGTRAPRAHEGKHRFKTTIWEYKVAKKYNLIWDEEIHLLIDIPKRTNFKEFVLPYYDKRQKLKEEMRRLKAQGLENTTQFDELKKDDMVAKFLLNNGYGKFAQNPRRYKENYFTEVGCEPEDGAEAWGGQPVEMTSDYHVWQRPSPSDRYNNVATGASITGAARSVLLEAIMNSVDPVYCDTDSLICKELKNTETHESKLGAWDIECEMSLVIIAGKKLYGYIRNDEKQITKAKGASTMTFDEIERIYDGEILVNTAKGVTLTKTGKQHYMERRISATASNGMDPDGKSVFWRC